MGKNVKSSTIELAPIDSKESSQADFSGNSQATDTSLDKTSSRRMRLTQILIRSQKELQLLEDQRKTSPQGLDPLSEQKIIKLTDKIATIEKMITEIK